MNDNIVSVSLYIEYREGVCLVVLAQVRESLFVVFYVPLYRSPARTVVVAGIRYRNKREAVLFLVYIIVAAYTERTLYLVKNPVCHTPVLCNGLVLEAVQVLVVPYLNPLAFCPSVLSVIPVLTGKQIHLARYAVNMRVQGISVKERQRPRPKLAIREITDYRRVCGYHIGPHRIVHDGFHGRSEPSHLKFCEPFLEFVTLGNRLASVYQFKLHVVARDVEYVLCRYDLLEGKSGPRYRLQVPLASVFRLLGVVVRIHLPYIRIFLIVENPVCGRIILPKEVGLRLYEH